jgi:SAM-dependent methyltransferase
LSSDDLLAYYGEDKEEDRLLTPGGMFEFERMQRLLARFVQEGARVADVGGGTGRYAEWLASRGCTVELVDPVALHVERAVGRGLSARVGDARSLPFADDTFDAVLLLGPLYHLGERDDRVVAVREAARVCRSGGVVCAAAISRYGPLLDQLTRGLIFDEVKWANVRDETRDGRRVPAGRRTGLFPDAWFHLPEELREELVDGGLDVRGVYAVQGVAWLAGGFDFEEAWNDPPRRARLLEVAELTEEDPHVISASPHLLGVGTAP